MPPDNQASPVVSDSKTPKAVTPSASKTLFHYFSSKEASETSKKDAPVAEKVKDNCEDEVKIVEAEQNKGKKKKTSPGFSKKRKKTQSEQDSEDEKESDSKKQKKLKRSKSKSDKRTNFPVRAVRKVSVESEESSGEDKDEPVKNKNKKGGIKKLFGKDEDQEPKKEEKVDEKHGVADKQDLVKDDDQELNKEEKMDDEKHEVADKQDLSNEIKIKEVKTSTKKKKLIIESDESDDGDSDNLHFIKKVIYNESTKNLDDDKKTVKTSCEVTEISDREDNEVFENVDKKEEKVPPPVTTPKSISNFFSKVTKEKRLMQSEKDVSTVKVTAMVHVSPQSEDKKPKEDEVKSNHVNPSRRNKRKISNVSRSSAETDVIEVFEVEETVEEPCKDSQEESVEVELGSNLTPDDAVVKISTLLKTGKRDRSEGTPSNTLDGVDDKEKMEVNEKSPTQSPVKKSSKLDLSQKEKAKSAFAVLMSKDKAKEGKVGNKVDVKDEGGEKELLKDVCDENQSKEKEEKSDIKEVKKSIRKKKLIIESDESDSDNESDVDGEKNQQISKPKTSENIVKSKLSAGTNAFAMLMKPKKDIKADMEVVEVANESKDNEENKENVESSDKGQVGRDAKSENSPKSPLANSKLSGKGNAFAMLMKPKDKKKDTEDLMDKSILETNKNDENLIDGNDVEPQDPKPKRSRQRKSSGTVVLEDEKVNTKISNEKMRKVLSWLQKKDVYDLFAEPIDLEDVPDYLDIIKNPMDFATMRTKIENCEYSTLDDLENDFIQITDNCLSYNEESTDIYQAGVDLRESGFMIFSRERGKIKSKPVEDVKEKDENVKQPETPTENAIPTPKFAETADDNNSEDEKDKEDNIEVIELDGEKTIYEVTCKDSKGEFHHDKFVSGGKGLSIFFNGKWMTPNEFERAAGSRSKKYKASLYVNGKPIIKLIDPYGTRQDRTPSISKRGDRSRSCTPDLEGTPKLVKRKKKKHLDKENDGDAANLSNVEEDDEENSGGRKRSGRIARNKVNYGDDDSEIEELDASPKKGKGKGKVASIFMLGKKPPPVPEDPEKVAARKAFLMSAAPDVCRVQMDEYELQASLASLPFTFPTVSHVQQKGDESGWSLGSPVPPISYRTQPFVSYRQEMDEIEQNQELDLEHFTKACDGSTVWVPDFEQPVIKMSPIEVGRAVAIEKVNNSGFPVNRVFRRYCERKLEAESFEIEARDKNIPLEEVESQRFRKKRRSKGRLSNDGGKTKEDKASLKYSTDRSCGLQWTNKYQPRCAEDMVGNLGETRRLRGWLKDWSASDKRQRLSQTESDSFEDSDASYDSDTEAGEGLGNTAVLTGPNGVGKTAAVYAVAVELGFKVFEVNASSARTGRQVLASLHEATQSQQVTQKESGQQNMQGLFNKKKNTENSEKESKTTLKTALILLEDIDIVFDELDDGFYAAVNSLVQLTKRPIIMTSSDRTFFAPNGPSSKLFRNEPQKFNFVSVTPSLVANYLHLMCLAEGHYIDETCLADLTENCNIGKCILQLQFHAESSRHTSEQEDSNDALDENLEKNHRVKKKCVLAQSAKFESEASETEASGTGDLEEDDDDVLKELIGTDRRKLGSCKLPSPSKSPVFYPTTSYCHYKWLRDLPLRNQEPVAASKIYPLKQDGEQQKKYKKIDPLLNSSLFTADSENEDDESDNKPADLKDEVTKAPKTALKIPQTAEEREKFKLNQSALQGLSKHMDAVAEFDSEVSERLWYKEFTTKDSLCQNFPSFPDCPGRNSSILQTCLRMSENVSISTISKLPELDPIPTCQVKKKWKKHVMTSQRELLSFWPDPSVLTEDCVMEVLGALRGIARGEEERRVGTPQAGRRGGRFQHYFNSLDIHLKKSVLNNLCNSLIDE